MAFDVMPLQIQAICCQYTDIHTRKLNCTVFTRIVQVISQSSHDAGSMILCSPKKERPITRSVTQSLQHPLWTNLVSKLLIYGLFKNNVNSSDYILLNCRMISEWSTENDGEAIMTQFEVLSLHFPGRTDENHEKPLSG